MVAAIAPPATAGINKASPTIPRGDASGERAECEQDERGQPVESEDGSRVIGIANRDGDARDKDQGRRDDGDEAQALS
jgi:hypothetical protein